MSDGPGHVQNTVLRVERRGPAVVITVYATRRDTPYPLGHGDLALLTIMAEPVWLVIH